MLYHFNQAPREDGYSPSELFHSTSVRSHLPCLDDTVDVDKGKAARELKDMVVKNATKTHKPLKPLNRSWIEPSESLLNKIHQAKNLKVKYDTSTCHQIKEGNVSYKKIKVPTGCLRSKNLEPHRRE